ncbi:hypothetical protein ACWCRF_23180 [Streptomyces sp. NPDC002405]|uniref:hypothetical protein n=1 Tax=Streptomyces sp. NPDC057596 TaxID=3346178 RepID=UPI00369CCCA8
MTRAMTQAGLQGRADSRPLPVREVRRLAALLARAMESGEPMAPLHLAFPEVDGAEAERIRAALLDRTADDGPRWAVIADPAPGGERSLAHVTAGMVHPGGRVLVERPDAVVLRARLLLRLAPGSRGLLPPLALCWELRRQVYGEGPSPADLVAANAGVLLVVPGDMPAEAARDREPGTVSWSVSAAGDRVASGVLTADDVRDDLAWAAGLAGDPFGYVLSRPLGPPLGPGVTSATLTADAAGLTRSVTVALEAPPVTGSRTDPGPTGPRPSGTVQGPRSDATDVGPRPGR